MRNGLHPGHFKHGIRSFCALLTGRQAEILAIKPQSRTHQVAETLLSRTLKTKVIVRAESLPDASASQKEALPDIDDDHTYPTMLQQVRENMRMHKDCVLLTRVGSFYELYFEQAEKYGPLLNLTKARKRVGKGTVPMVWAKTPG